VTDELRRIEHDAFSGGEWHVDALAGVAGALVAAGPISVGLALDRPNAGLSAALGALNVALGTPATGRLDQARWGGFSVVACTLAAALATVVHPSTPALIATTLLVTLAGAELRRFGEHGALGGFVVSAVFIIVAGLPASEPVPQLMLQFLLGGLFGLAVMVAVGRLRGSTAAEPSKAAVGPADERALLSHAGRVGVAVSIATLLYRVLDLNFGYWVPLTTLAVLQPEPHASWVKSLQRVAGTLVGTIIVVLVTIATSNPWPITAMVAVSAFTLFALRDRTYFWFVVAITPTALLMISTVVPEGSDLAANRIVTTALGLAIALVVTAGIAVWSSVRARS
jgi:hypothetical protein